VEAINKAFTVRALCALALGCAALVAPACGGDDTPAGPEVLPGPTPTRGDCSEPLGISCPAGMYCDYAASTCGAGDVLGMCRTIPDVCTEECSRTCGCDGLFYCNACVAHMAGVDDAADRSCSVDPHRRDPN
jgi:hypothetical protein